MKRLYKEKKKSVMNVYLCFWGNSRLCWCSVPPCLFLNDYKTLLLSNSFLPVPSSIPDIFILCSSLYRAESQIFSLGKGKVSVGLKIQSVHWIAKSWGKVSMGILKVPCLSIEDVLHCARELWKYIGYFLRSHSGHFSKPT